MTFATARAEVTAPSTPPAGDPVSFDDGVLLTKAEVFAACQILADADRAMHRGGLGSAAGPIGDLFELLEHRLSKRPFRGPDGCCAGRSDRLRLLNAARAPDQPPSASGTKSRESEFTQ